MDNSRALRDCSSQTHDDATKLDNSRCALRPSGEPAIHLEMGVSFADTAELITAML